MQQIPLVDVSAQWASVRAELEARFAEVLDSGQFIRGPQYYAFEQEAAAYLGVKGSVGVANGTDVSFELARAADVAVTVQNGNGVTVATVLVKKLTAGAQHATWNGKPRSSYRVQVVATNSIGTVAEAVPFGSRRK